MPAQCLFFYYCEELTQCRQDLFWLLVFRSRGSWLAVSTVIREKPQSRNRVHQGSWCCGDRKPPSTSGSHCFETTTTVKIWVRLHLPKGGRQDAREEETSQSHCVLPVIFLPNAPFSYHFPIAPPAGHKPFTLEPWRNSHPPNKKTSSNPGWPLLNLRYLFTSQQVASCLCETEPRPSGCCTTDLHLRPYSLYNALRPVSTV